jgi:hypothetical protein
MAHKLLSTFDRNNPLGLWRQTMRCSKWNPSPALLFTGPKIDVLWLLGVASKEGHLIVGLESSAFGLDFRGNRMCYTPTFSRDNIDDLALEI